MHCHNTFTACGTEGASSTPDEGTQIDELNPAVMETSAEKVKDWLSEQEENAKRCFDEELSDDNLETFLSGEQFFLLLCAS